MDDQTAGQQAKGAGGFHRFGQTEPMGRVVEQIGLHRRNACIKTDVCPRRLAAASGVDKDKTGARQEQVQKARPVAGMLGRLQPRPCQPLGHPGTNPVIVAKRVPDAHNQWGVRR